jgi:hypothetical protein
MSFDRVSGAQTHGSSSAFRLVSDSAARSPAPWLIPR